MFDAPQDRNSWDGFGAYTTWSIVDAGYGWVEIEYCLLDQPCYESNPILQSMWPIAASKGDVQQEIDNAKPKRIIVKPKKWTNYISFFSFLPQVPTKLVSNLAPSTMGPMSLLVYDSTCSRTNFQI